MKIVVLSPAHPLRGGIAASSERLAQALQESGHTVVVYSFKLQYPAFLFPGKTQYSSDPAPADLTIKTVLNSINPFNWIRVGRALAYEQPDKVIVRFWMPFMGPCLGTVLRVARWFSPKKIQITALVDNIIPHEARMGDRLLSNYFIGACNDFVVMSESVGAAIRHFLPENASAERVRFAPHPIYDIYGTGLAQAAARKQIGLPDSARKVVLFFGLIRPYKGLDILLHAMADPQMADIHLIVAGECYEDWARYQQIIDTAKIEKNIHLFLDFIPNDAVAQYFSAADLVVQPYKTATQSGVLQIAYHFDRPVIVTRVGGLPEMVAPGVSGYVVAPDDPTALATCMADFFQQQPDMSAGIRNFKQQFSWKNLVHALGV